MELFQVYNRFEIEIDHARDVYVYDAEGQPYLDLYGGHGVISIGHQHPRFTARITEQLKHFSFYSNSVQIRQQETLAELLGPLSGYPDHRLFLCNSGAEAVENALKLAAFHTGRKKVIAFHNSFHGRTAAALNVTDFPRLRAPINQANFPVDFFPLNQPDLVLESISKGDVAAVILEGIQGVGGLDQASTEFLSFLSAACSQFGTLLILDEIQSGYGRSGQFFAHQFAGITADLVTVAKGMGNGFPIGGVLIHPKIEAHSGMLGTTFGGNPLACAAGIAVLEILAEENWLAGIPKLSAQFIELFKDLPGVVGIKGQGLMLGIEFGFPVKELRKRLLFEHHIFTGSASNPHLLRILPPLSIQLEHLQHFAQQLQSLCHEEIHLA